MRFSEWSTGEQILLAIVISALCGFLLCWFMFRG